MFLHKKKRRREFIAYCKIMASITMVWLDGIFLEWGEMMGERGDDE